MPSDLRLMCILAHPDDESLGTGGTLAHYADEGIETFLLTATPGERGWPGDPAAHPGPQELARIREQELRQAAEVLGVTAVELLGYPDGELDRADPRQATGLIASRIRRHRPQVVVTFGPEGAYGHPDHIAISQLASAAVICAADPAYRDPEDLPAFRALKLYYKVWSAAELAAYEQVFPELVIEVDGVARRTMAWQDWAITTRLDTQRHWERVWRAVLCHRSQLPAYDRLRHLPPDTHRAIWSTQGFYRAFSSVNGGRAMETDLFAGLR